MIDQSEVGLRSVTVEPEARPNPWPALIEKIRSDDASGMEELYRVFSRGVRFFLWRQIQPQDLEDTMHDIFLTVAQAVRHGDVREPERLMGFVWTIVRRHVAGHIERSIGQRNHYTEIEGAIHVSDRREDPEYTAIVRQRVGLARTVLSEVSPRDREILVRFYLNEEPPDQICREMGLTETQFRLLKSRAKARFGELGRRRLARRKISRSA